MLLFGLWIILLMFAIRSVLGLFGAGMMFRGRDKDAEMKGCASAVGNLVVNGLSIWVLISAIIALS